MPDVKLNTMEEDEFLWHLISRGDRKAFSSFFSKYYTILYSYSRYYVSAEDAEEIVQDVMLWLWEKRGEFQPSGTMQHYLLVSVKNRCMNTLQRQNKEFCDYEFFMTELESFYESTDSCVLKELENIIEKAISELPDSYRETFEMSRFQNMGRAKIAEELGISVKTVDYRMQQSLTILRNQLKDYLPLVIFLGRFVG